MSKTSKYPGVTAPMSLAMPTPAEEAMSASLVQLLQERDQYETEEEAQKREVVLTKLDAIFKEFVRHISQKRSLPDSIDAGGKIFTFGSYRLGVHGKASDIDTLCVAPKHVQRDDFFTDMVDMLKERKEVTDLSAVTDAYVPVIKFCFSGIEIDLLCARLALPTVPDDLELADDNLLKNLDDRCVRSLNGSRVTDEILRLVPNVDSFRTALRCIKLWAKQRAIYSNAMGFFGGVAWAIAVARICQLYPHASPGIIVNKFFYLMMIWNWPNPVILKQIEEGPLPNLKVWNPRANQSDKAHRMPIITPAYPSMCSTHNVTQSTFSITMEEFKRGYEISDKIIGKTKTWADLMEKHDFFQRYKYYLQIITSCATQGTHLLWSGFVESRLRQLVMKLEMLEFVAIAHPYIKSIQKITPCQSQSEAIAVAEGKTLPANDPATANSTVPTIPVPSAPTSTSNEENADPSAAPPLTVYTTTFYIGLQIAPKDPNSNVARKVDISRPTNEFVALVKSWDKFEVQSMGIVVSHIKSSQLPSELAGERDLAKSKKRPRAAKGVTPAVDRAVKRVKTEEEEKNDASSAAATPDSNFGDGLSSTSADAVAPSEKTVNGVTDTIKEETVLSNQATAAGDASVVTPKLEEEPTVSASKITPNYAGLGGTTGFQQLRGGITVKLTPGASSNSSAG
ncbi:hypothetical protein CcCBS67573_g07418 [Chytriomyces confervae]|uniref:Poly(A) polymerase n=1 Tax=Chytriomyces confervae TaxID=246404 RepID=A0A507EU86_9FUNG|nr:hypothetical protein CcCBS67573_g07418 [Chytriomyces confervae]